MGKGPVTLQRIGPTRNVWIKCHTLGTHGAHATDTLVARWAQRMPNVGPTCPTYDQRAQRMTNGRPMYPTREEHVPIIRSLRVGQIRRNVTGTSVTHHVKTYQLLFNWGVFVDRP